MSIDSRVDRQYILIIGLHSIYIYIYILCLSGRFSNNEQLIQKNYALDRFSAELPTKVLIHGYIADRYHSSIEPIKNAYLTAADVNLIIVDWSKGAYQPYDVSRGLIPQVAIRVGEILEQFMSDYDLDKGMIHVVGHSLGAHIAGCVGRYFHGTLGRYVEYPISVGSAIEHLWCGCLVLLQNNWTGSGCAALLQILPRCYSWDGRAVRGYYSYMRRGFGRNLAEVMWAS